MPQRVAQEQTLHLRPERRFVSFRVAGEALRRPRRIGQRDFLLVPTTAQNSAPGQSSGGCDELSYAFRRRSNDLLEGDPFDAVFAQEALEGAAVAVCRARSVAHIASELNQ